MMNLRAFTRAIEISEHGPAGSPESHRHANTYAAIVLQGEYTEISADGKMVARPGDLVVHPAFHWHTNVFTTSAVKVLNLKLPIAAGVCVPYGRLPLAELPLSQDDIVHYPDEGAAAIIKLCGLYGAAENQRAENDRLGTVRQHLNRPRALKVRQIAADVGMSAEHLARQFRARYGLSPVEYRGEYRFRHAVRELFAGQTAAVAACNSGYSDQSHMSRDIRLRIGMTPRQLQSYLKPDASRHVPCRASRQQQA